MIPRAPASASKRSLARENFGRNAEFPNLTGDQMAILTARIEYRNLGRRVYFRILSTMILCALSSSACAFGIASMAASHFGIGLDLELIGLIHAERGLVDFGLQPVADPVVILRVIGFRELDLCSTAGTRGSESIVAVSTAQSSGSFSVWVAKKCFV